MRRYEKKEYEKKVSIITRLSKDRHSEEARRRIPSPYTLNFNQCYMKFLTGFFVPLRMTLITEITKAPVKRHGANTRHKY